MRWNLEWLKSALSAIRSWPFRRPIHFDEESGTYINTNVYGGFPLGGIGTGGMRMATSGGFVSTSTSHNWMSPHESLDGCFWALRCKSASGEWRRILRQHPSPKKEYRNVTPVRDVSFLGQLPVGELRYTEEWPVSVEVLSFSPFVPHRPEDSCLPLVSFSVKLQNTGDVPIDVDIAMSWENLVGVGGTGQTGIEVKRKRWGALHGRAAYNERKACRQRPCLWPGYHGLEFYSELTTHARSHQQSTLGQHFLLCEEQEGLDITTLNTWDATSRAPAWLSSWTTATLPSFAVQEHESYHKPAGVVSAGCRLEARDTKDIHFTLLWWMPHHVTEREVIRDRQSEEHEGIDVGQWYTTLFADPESLASSFRRRRAELLDESQALQRLLAESSLPRWIQRAMINASDSVLTNTLLPKDGTMYTLEAANWPWFFGGLCGTNDQRLVSHAFTSTFFPSLDRSELDSFRRLMRDGAIPHGNGNCDLALGSSDVPYGWPMRMKGDIVEQPWPDLNLSLILQICRLYRTTGDEAWITECWPDLLEMLHYVEGLLLRGLPEGGSTYDTFSFPPGFVYTAGLYVAALEAMCDLASEREPEQLARLRGMQQVAKARIASELWSDDFGYYRTAPSRNTLFVGAMAGDWVSRYHGFNGAFPIERVRAHLELAHKHFFRSKDGRRGRAAFPISEIQPNGKPRRHWISGVFQVFGYAWQVLAYHGMACIHAGLVAEGLETLHILYQRVWHRGWPWSADLYGNAGPSYMSHMVLWTLPFALTGAALDVPRRTMRLSPRLLPATREGTYPCCFPQFWAIFRFKRLADSWSCDVEIVRHIGEPIWIEHLIVSDLEGRRWPVSLHEPWLCQKGSLYHCAWPAQPEASEVLPSGTFTSGGDGKIRRGSVQDPQPRHSGAL